MPNYGCGASEARRIQKSKDIRARLIAKGLDPRSMGFSRAYFKAMRK